MKSILIQGQSNHGKSTTMNEICKRLQPEKVYQLEINHKYHNQSKLIEKDIDEIFNNTFIIKVKGLFILICAGAPTEQRIKISIIINICIEINIDIKLAIVSMRSSERMKDFDTPKELKELSEIILHERIYKIPGDDFKETEEWKNRINNITNKVLNIIELN